MCCVSISLRGNVREIGPERLPLLFAKNKYMEEIYPTRARIRQENCLHCGNCFRDCPVHAVVRPRTKRT